MNRWMILILVLVYLLVGLRVNFVSWTDRSGRDHVKGDGYSDKNTFSAALYFRDFGFWDSKLRPIHRYKGDLDKSNLEIYTHYPAFPDVYSGLWAQLPGGQDERVQRLGGVVLSFLLLWIIWLFANWYFPNKQIRNWSFILLITSVWFVFWADNMHKHLHEYLAFWISLLVLSKYYTGTFKVKWIWIFGPCFAVWAANSSFEAIILVAATVVGFSVAFEKGWRRILAPINLWLGVWFVIGFGMHIYLNGLAIGGFQAALNDISDIYLKRTGVRTGLSHDMSTMDLLSLPVIFINRLERYFPVPGWALVLFFIWQVREKYSTDKVRFKVLWIALVASYAWFLFMPQHAFVHHFTAKHIAPLFLMVAVPGLVQLWNWFKNADSKFKKIIPALILIYIFVMAVTQVYIPVFWTGSVAKVKISSLI